MKNIKVLSITIKGFKGHKEEVTYNLKDYTKIIGDNNQGKTTIGESITWGLFGSNLFGNDKADSDLVNKSSDYTHCIIRYEDEEGLHELSRVKKSRITLKLDGKKITQTNLNERLVSKEIFLSIFNPCYFPSMQSMPARNMLVKILPQINSEDVLMSLEDVFVKILDGIDLTDTNTNLLIKDFKTKLKKADENILTTEGSLNAKQSMLDSIVIPEELAFDDTELKALQAEYESLLTQKAELIDLSVKQQEKANIEKDLALLDKKQAELEDTKTLELQVSDYRGQYKGLKNQLESSFEMGDVCPSCGQSISQEHKDACIVKIIEQMSEIEQKAKDIIDIEIKEITRRNKEKQEKFNKNLEADRQVLLDKLAAIDINNVTKENEKIQLEFNKSMAEKKNTIKSKINLIEIERQKVVNNNMQIPIYLKNKSDLEVKIKADRETLDTLRKSKDHWNLLLASLKAYNKKYINILTNKIQQNLDKVSIVIQEITKEGEIKDTFQLYYKGKEYRILSNSDKIRVGLEIGQLIMNCLDIKCPIFIDNAESITRYVKPDTQVIEAIVAKDQKLML